MPVTDCTRDARALRIACVTGDASAARHVDVGGHGRGLRRRGLRRRVVGSRAVAVEGARRTPVRLRDTQQKSRSGTGEGQHMPVHAGILGRVGGDSGAPLADGHPVEFDPQEH